MRYLAVALLLAPLAGCAGSGVERVDAQKPTVSYRYDSEREFEEAHYKADIYCQERYDRRARLIDDDTYRGDRIATFECG